MKKSIKHLPTFLMGPILSILAYISLNLGIGIPFLGVKAKQQGVAYITNIGSFGLDAAFAPLCPPMMAPFLFCMGKS